jgi:hypothetical protein
MTTTWTEVSKNTSTWGNINKNGTTQYILTDILDYILVGTSEDEVLVWDDVLVWDYQTKN